MGKHCSPRVMADGVFLLVHSGSGSKGQVICLIHRKSRPLDTDMGGAHSLKITMVARLGMSDWSHLQEIDSEIGHQKLIFP